jgi:hypothetical protein
MSEVIVYVARRAGEGRNSTGKAEKKEKSLHNPSTTLKTKLVSKFVKNR